MTAVIEIDPRGIYYYFLTDIKYDYFERHDFNTSPNLAGNFVNCH
jgi:hypothetical protein